MKKQDFLNLLNNVKTGKIKIDDVIQQATSSRKMLMEKVQATKIADLNEKNCYFVKSGELFSLPLNKKRGDGRIAEFVPYYRTKNA